MAHRRVVWRPTEASSQNDTICYEDLLRRTPRIAEVREKLARVPLAYALKCLQRIGSDLYFAELQGLLNRDPGVQLGCLQELGLGNDPLSVTTTRLLKEIHTYPPVIFHREQIAVATAFAVASCDEGTATGDIAKAGVLLLHVLLTINTYLVRNTFGNDPRFCGVHSPAKSRAMKY